MSAMHLIEGEVETPDERRIQELLAENVELRQELDQARREAADATRNATRAITRLRGQLEPLYRALRGIFGEMDAAGVGESASVPASSPGVSDTRVLAVWTSWKQRVSPACGKVIDALLQHGELNTAQLKVAAGIGSSTVSDSIFKLNKLGLISKNGGRFSLKAL